MTLSQRLNLWYAAVLLATLLLGGAAVEIVSDRLASHRRTQLVERIQAEVTRAYEAGGLDAAADLEFPGVDIQLYDDEGVPLLGDVQPGDPAPVAMRTRIVKGVWLQTSIPDETIAQTRRDARLAVAGGGLVVLLVGLGGGLWATRRALAPVRAVAETARHIVDTGDMTATIPSPGTRDDLDQMVRMFNDLLQTDRQRIQQMRTSLDSIGHDLRTPMTRIRAAAELALSHGDPAAMEDALATAIEEATASEQLLTRLLDLTRAEAGMLPLDLRDVALSDVVARVASLYEHVAEERGVRLIADAPRDLVAPLDPTRIEQALANLVDNAIKFSPEGGTVRIAARATDGRVRLVVEDEGPGIPEAERELVFQRLYRGDESRHTEGAGLGLAMVRAIARAHGGDAWVEPGSSGGTRAVVALPRARPE